MAHVWYQEAYEMGRVKRQKIIYEIFSERLLTYANYKDRIKYEHMNKCSYKKEILS